MLPDAFASAVLEIGVFAMITASVPIPMRDWFSTLATKSSLPVSAVSDVAVRGLVFLLRPMPSDEEMNAFVAGDTQR